MPTKIIENQMKEEFVLPEALPMSQTGGLVFKMSSIIKPLSFKNAITKLRQLKNGKNRLLESQDSTTTEDPSAGKLENEQELKALTQLLKLTESIQTSLVPADEFKAQKKAYTW